MQQLAWAMEPQPNKGMVLAMREQGLVSGRTINSRAGKTTLMADFTHLMKAQMAKRDLRDLHFTILKGIIRGKWEVAKL